MKHPEVMQYLPTVRHFHNHLELQIGKRRNSNLRSSGKLAVTLRGLIFLWLASLSHLALSMKQDGCIFPHKWTGKWFQSGVIQSIVIEGDRLSSKGKCLSSEGDKFLLVDEKGCYRCVVIHEKHINVLQYKETFCHRKEALPNLCSLITGDALLYSMFRENATPEPCPLEAPFSFTYNRGHGECKNPVSSIESCTEESRLLLNYQACPDVHGSESTVEELECLATWKEGSLKYFVGKLHHNHATSNEDRYRCFVFEKSNGIGSHTVHKDGDGVEYRVAQSGDATCNGLFSATEGSRTMALKSVPTPWKCRFPSWMTFPGHWHTLDYSSTYSFHQRNATLRITNETGSDVKVHCVSVKASSPSGNSVALIVHWQHHCVGRFVCMVMFKRDSSVAELQRGTAALRPDDACATHHFNPSSPYVTLVTSNPEARQCPNSGKFTITDLKVHQRITRSVSPATPTSVDHITQTPKHHKKPHRKHNSKTEIERKKEKYENSLRRIFAKEARKRDSKLLHRKHHHNSTSPRLNSNSTEELVKSANLSLSDFLRRAKRSTDRFDNSPCHSNDFNFLEVGCNMGENMEFFSKCNNKEMTTAYSCHGGWFENGTSFLITTPLTRDSIGAKRYCFLYRESESGILHFTRLSVDCDRSVRPGIDGPLVFNASATGECMETSGTRTLSLALRNTVVIAIAAFYIQAAIVR